MNERIREMAQVAQQQKTEMGKAMKEVIQRGFQLKQKEFSFEKQLEFWRSISEIFRRTKILIWQQKKHLRRIINVSNRLFISMNFRS